MSMGTKVERALQFNLQTILLDKSFNLERKTLPREISYMDVMIAWN